MRHTERVVALPDVAPSAIVALSRHALSGAFEPYRVLARDAKAQTREQQANIDFGGGRAPTD
jgi:hypothetical protein